MPLRNIDLRFNLTYGWVIQQHIFLGFYNLITSTVYDKTNINFNFEHFLWG